MTIKNSVQRSLKRSETVRGYTVRRLPLGEYLAALDALSDLPETVVEALFEEEDVAQALARLRHMDTSGVVRLMLRLLTVAPQEAVRVLALLTGVPQEALLTDPTIGLDGAAEMLEAFLRLNGLENFTRAVGRVAAQVKRIRAGIGSNA